MSFELCFRARENTADDRRPVGDRRPLPSWADLAPACVSLPASVHVDTIGQKVQIDDLNAGTWTFGYDDAGNLAWHEDPRGNRFAFGYDDGNRLIWEDCVSGPTCGPEIELRYFYNSPATWENGEGFFPAGIVDHDGIELPQTHVLGRLAWVQDRARRTYTSYDARGEVVAQAKNLHGIAMVPDENAPEVLKQVPVGDAELFYVSTRELDDVGRVRRETLVDGTELDYTYDRRGLLATLSGVYQNRALTFIQSVDYDLQGRRVAAALGGGIRETKTYNQVGRTLESVRVLVDETETPLAEVLHLAYTYDRLGLLTSQTDLRADGLRFAESSAPTVKTYTYDGQGQLMTSDERLVSDPSALVRRMRYDYDVLGNIVEKHTTRCVETTFPCTEQDDPTDEYYTHWFGTATYNGDQLISADGGDGNSLVATYDVAGNMETLAVTRGGQPYFTHTYTWDEQNRLASAVGTGQLFHGGQGVVAVAGYAYDNGGARIAALRAKTFVGVELEETLYIDPSFEIRNGEHTTYIHDSKGRMARLLPIDDNIISKITWLHADHLGSTSLVTAEDGTFVEETKYLPYGAVQSTHRPDDGLPYEPFGFTGKEAEPDFGILYFGARYYNPHLARWISPDPLFLHVTSESAEKSQNGFCYASNDPVNRVDPDGLWDGPGPIDMLSKQDSGEAPSDIAGPMFARFLWSTFGGDFLECFTGKGFLLEEASTESRMFSCVVAPVSFLGLKQAYRAYLAAKTEKIISAATKTTAISKPIIPIKTGVGDAKPEVSKPTPPKSTVQKVIAVKSTSRGSLTIVEGGSYSASEINAARHMSSLGHNVILRPPAGTRAGGGTSDLLVNGVRYDVYTPKTLNPDRIISSIAHKNSQAEGIVLDLSNTTVTEKQLGNILERVQGAGAVNIKDIVVFGGK